MLTIQNLTYRIAGKLLLDEANLTVPEGTKLGLVGKNGCGKSTLFKLITDDLQPESGDISLPKRMRYGQVAQEAPAGPESLIDFVLAADKERLTLLAEADTATDPERISDIYARLSDIDAYSAESRAAIILSGLGFNEVAQKRPCSEYSGGWRMRVALAAVLFSEPDLLLLDEPTNYLDLEGTLWLTSYLRKYRHTIIIISHDRSLLNEAVEMIAHFEHKTISTFRGNYDQFERQRREKQILLQKSQEKQLAHRAHMQAFVDRFRYTASKAKQAQSRLKAIEKMADVRLLLDENTSPIHFPAPEKRLAPPILQLENAAVGYEPGKAILSNLSLRIDDDDRIGLLGQNGNGKSTFAKLISGRLEQQSGSKVVAPKMKIAYFAQHQLDELTPGNSAFDHVRPLMPDAHVSKVRARVAQMGLGTEKIDTLVQNLSGGEKARLLLGIATFHGAHLLILDEPTNHLDIDSRQALVDALNQFPGAVIIISHDPSLLDACVDRMWLVSDGTVAPYEGDLDSYKRMVLSEKRKTSDPSSSATAQSVNVAKPQQSKEDRKASAANRKSLAPLRKEVKELEAEIKSINGKISRCDAKLADGEMYINAPTEAAVVSQNRASHEKDLAQTEARWLELSEQLEKSMA